MAGFKGAHHATSRSTSVGSSAAVRELFTRRDTGHTQVVGISGLRANALGARFKEAELIPSESSSSRQLERGEDHR